MVPADSSRLACAPLTLQAGPVSVDTWLPPRPLCNGVSPTNWATIALIQLAISYDTPYIAGSEPTVHCAAHSCSPQAAAMDEDWRNNSDFAAGYNNSARLPVNDGHVPVRIPCFR